MDQALLDTDVLSELIKGRNQAVIGVARIYLGKYQHLAFSAYTFYEVVRGLKSRGATRQLDEFLDLAEKCEVLPISLPILLRAAELWAVATASGRSRDDADLIIAATALESGLILATGNTSHFGWIPRLRTENWGSAIR